MKNPQSKVMQSKLTLDCYKSHAWLLDYKYKMITFTSKVQWKHEMYVCISSILIASHHVHYHQWPKSTVKWAISIA